MHLSFCNNWGQLGALHVDHSAYGPVPDILQLVENIFSEINI
jgi:hypothetical protein